MTPPDWPHRLNPPQRRAVEHGDGPLLVLAGAGSGKTRVLIHRIAYLIEVRQVLPSAIVAVTFTNRAADEMRRRVDALIDDESAADAVHISTFHSLGALLLRRYADRAGLDWNFSIYDQDDQRRLLSDVLDRMGHDSSRSTTRRHLRAIEGHKNRGHTPRQAQERAFDARHERRAEIYQNYQGALRDAGAVDFGDLILQPVAMFRDQPRFAQKLSRLWRYLLVDEFQDTNPAQYELLEHLTATHDNLAVVGDDDQAIYRWRGANPAHILGFESAFETTEVVKLEQNYRSTQLILDAANDVIDENDRRYQKELWTDRPPGEPIAVFTARDDREEASWVAETIFDQLKKGAEPDDIAVFYRTNAQGRLFEQQLRRWGIDYRIVGGTSFYDRTEIKDVLAYLRCATNRRDDVATLRVINTPRRGVGDKTVEKLEDARLIDGVDSIQDAVELACDDTAQTHLFDDPHLQPDELACVERLQSLRGVSKGGVTTFRRILEETRDDLLHFESLRPVVERLLERIAYEEHLQKVDPDSADDRLRNLGELLGAIEDFESDPATPERLESVREAIPDDVDDPLAISGASVRLRAFLDQSALVRQTDNDGGVVRLMTIHSSKGLEFDTVFLVGMEDETFPSIRDESDPEEMAEERRLAYVAITRAKNRLFVTNAMRRRIYGNYKNTEPSRFLLDISPDFLHLDPRSAATSIDYRAPSRPSTTDRYASSSARNNSSGWSFDQSTDADLFRQNPPDWSPSSQIADGVDTQTDDEPSNDGLVGATVSHSRFGVGEVLDISGSGDSARLTVNFPTVGQKTVVRKFLKILG